MSCLAVTLLIGSTILIGCKDDSVSDTFRRSTLDREYTFVVGVLTPNSERSYPQEVFVGRIIPNDDPPTPVLGKDSIVNRVLKTMRYEYFAEIQPGPSATVWIEDDNGIRHQLQNVGNGFYRDSDNALHVKHSGHYRLVVKQDGETFLAETTVPERFTITAPLDGDTVVVPFSHVPHLTDSMQLLNILWTPSNKAAFYRIAAQRSDVEFTTLDHTFLPSDSKLAYPFTLNHLLSAQTWLQIEAIDSNYAAMYAPTTSYTYSDAWEQWYKGQAEQRLGKRSSVSGNQNVAGVFGSFAQARVAFTAVP